MTSPPAHGDATAVATAVVAAPCHHDPMDMRRLSGILLLLVPCACSEPAGDRAAIARIDTLPSGLVQVTNTGAPAWAPEKAWRLEEDLRLGTADGGGPEQFGLIGAVRSDSRGAIYVLDVLAQEIRVFRPDGAFSHTIGRKGKGPGELWGATGMAFGPGDTLWVLDLLTNRYTAFGEDGAFLTSRPRRLQGAGSESGVFLANGRYLDWGLAFPDEGPSVVAGARVIQHPVALSSDFQRQDSMPPLEVTQRMVTIAGRTVPVSFFSDVGTLSVDRGGSIWFARGNEYRVYRRSLEGDTTLVFTLPAKAAPVGEAEREYVRTRMARRPEQLRGYLDALPAFKPIIHKILADGAGHIYVIPDVAGAPAGTIIDVFRENGEFLGRMTLPTPVPLLPPPPLVASVTPEHLLLVVTDEEGVPYLSRLRIVRPR